MSYQRVSNMVTDQLQGIQKEEQNKTEKSGWLGMQLGDFRLLVNLADVHEVLPVPNIQPVPLTKDWFLGMTNVRGNLVSVSDLYAWMGMSSTKINTNSRIVLLNSIRTTQVAILLDNVQGLQNLDKMQAVQVNFNESIPKLAMHQALFDVANYIDPQGQYWLTLNVDTLLADGAFIQAGLGA